MPFIRAKRQKSWHRELTYYYLVESYRENGCVRQRTLAYLGEYPSVEAALAGLPQDIEAEKRNYLNGRRQWHDEAKADYEKALADFSKLSGYYGTFPWYNEAWLERLRRRVLITDKRYRRAQHLVKSSETWLARLEARLAKLQDLSRKDCSA